MPANREGVLRVSFDPDKQFFEQNRQLRSLVTRELFKRSFQNCPALSEEFGAAFLTSDRQMMSNGSSITRWLSSDQVVRFKAVHKPHCPGMG